MGTPSVLSRAAGAGPAPRVDHVALAAGSQVGRYEIEAVLGQGGFGITYRAHDTQLDREVAIKEYLPAALAVRQDGATVLPRSTEVAADFDWGRQRFVEEGRTLASLHAAPSIVQVFDFLEENGTGYMVMALVEGQTLEKRIADAAAVGPGGLAPREIDALLWPLLDGLEKVHEAGFLHRDIKPANVLLDHHGKPILIDFGASRASLADRTATMTAIFTPGYAAAEQFSSARQGPWTDLYGLAATLYHAIAGAPPPSAIDRLLQDDCLPLARCAPEGFARTLLTGIDAALALHAGERPQSVAEWSRLLRPDVDQAAPTVVMEPVESRAIPAAAAEIPAIQSPTVETGPAKSSTARSGAIGSSAVEARAAAMPIAMPTPPTPPSPPTELAVGPRRRNIGRWLALASGVALLLAVGDYAFYSTRTPVGQDDTTRAVLSPVAAAVDPAPPAAPAVAAAVPETPAGEAEEEAALQLGTGDRQRAQRALTALGFDAGGSDGAFGPRSREMIAGWQRRHGRPPTGYLTAGQHKELLAEAKPGLDRADAERRTAAAASSPATAGSFDAVYGGSLTVSATGGGPAALRPVEADVTIVGGSLKGRLVHPQCGPLPVLLAVDAAGAISGSLRIPEALGCTLNPASASGRVRGGTLSLDIRGVDVTLRGTLAQRAGQEPRAAPPDPAGLRNNVP